MIHCHNCGIPLDAISYGTHEKQRYCLPCLPFYNEKEKEVGMFEFDNRMMCTRCKGVFNWNQWELVEFYPVCHTCLGRIPRREPGSRWLPVDGKSIRIIESDDLN